MKEHFKMLGCEAEDKVTKAKGVITSICFDLYGCIQVLLTPEADSKTNVKWYDITRIKSLSNNPVMNIPDFFDNSDISEGKKGPAEKPIQ